MKTKSFAVSDTVPVKTSAGFQPDWIYIATGGTFVFTTLEGTCTTTVQDGSWWPSDNVILVKATGTAATGFVAHQE